jgi:sigma-E factor negative regulatory protein RseA
MEWHMSNDSETNAMARERLSALVDGELEGAAVDAACARWRESAESRATWHAYHLMGDVLRSDDLAADPAREAAFLAALRVRLAGEPVVLAPAARAPDAPAAATRRRVPWTTSAAVAAGFVAVAGVLTLTRPGLPQKPTAAETIAQAPATKAVDVRTASGVPSGEPDASAAEPQTLVASGQLIRDARLDRYLAAHKQFAGSSALGVPSTYLRNATAEVAGR